jgi:hypothetical protein
MILPHGVILCRRIVMLKQIYNHINKALDKFGAYLSFRNYSREDRKGAFPMKGAVVLSSYRVNESVRIEWRFGGWGTRMYVESEPAESRLGTGFGIPGFSFYSSVVSCRRLGTLTKRIGHRQARVAVHDGAIWWDTPLANPDVFPSEEPWYVRGEFSFVDLLLGKVESKREPLMQAEPITVPMPEGAYLGTCSMYLVTVGRPRWFSTTTTVAEVRVEPGIAIPGKGENDYDIEDDVWCSMSTPASSPAEAVGIFVGSLLKKRWGRGGKSWRPDPSTGSRGDDTPNVPSDTTPPSGIHAASTIIPDASPVLN